MYDAVRGGPVVELAKKGGKLAGHFRFGPGEMRVFARTARPIGKVAGLTPIVVRDYTKAEHQAVVEVAGVLLDTAGSPLSGSVPIQVRLVDPLGNVRYDLYRATEQGTLKVSLPLAVNDPSGQWKVTLRELLGNTESTLAFSYGAPPQCGAMAGATQRAVVFGNDRENVFRFFRVHHDVTLVLGKGDYNQAAAERLAQILKPWGVRCKTVKAEDVKGPREISAEEAPHLGRHGARARPCRARPIRLTMAGFDVQGPVVLLGTPEDNPLIQFTKKQRFLPYAPMRPRSPAAAAACSPGSATPSAPARSRSRWWPTTPPGMSGGGRHALRSHGGHGCRSRVLTRRGRPRSPPPRRARPPRKHRSSGRCRCPTGLLP